LCIQLVIIKTLYYDARPTKYKKITVKVLHLHEQVNIMYLKQPTTYS
jgi:hypothetical protein